MSWKLAGANTTAQWFGGKYPGRAMNPRFIILHTTEGNGWNGYVGGGSGPHLTILPDTKAKKLVVRQHYRLDRTARALIGAEANDSGIQIELVGTSGWATSENPNRPYTVAFSWPKAPSWAIAQLGTIIGKLSRDHGIPLSAPWAFPSWTTSNRASWANFRKARGIIGHTHVPGNDHTDPGKLPIAAIIKAARTATGPTIPEEDFGFMAKIITRKDKVKLSRSKWKTLPLGDPDTLSLNTKPCDLDIRVQVTAIGLPANGQVQVRAVTASYKKGTPTQITKNHPTMLELTKNPGKSFGSGTILLSVPAGSGGRSNRIRLQAAAFEGDCEIRYSVQYMRKDK